MFVLINKSVGWLKINVILNYKVCFVFYLWLVKQ